MAIQLLSKKLETGDSINIMTDLKRSVIRIEPSFSGEKLITPLIVFNGCSSSPMTLGCGESFNYPQGIIGTLEVKQGAITIFF